MRMPIRLVLFAWVLIAAMAGSPLPARADLQDPAPYQSFPHLIPEINNFTGAAHQRIPITVPPGRNGIQPELYLTYNSYKQNGWPGVGWRIEIDAIARRTKRGVHYDRDEYELLSEGSKIELVAIGNDQYRPHIETDFTQYKLRRTGDGDYWEVTRKDGIKYFFGTGSDSQSRQINELGTFKWCLARVEDPNGNYMTIDYLVDEGRLYPQQIRYTGSHEQEPANRVVFENDVRPDIEIDCVSHVPVKTAKRLKSIQTYTYNDQPALEYRMEHELSPSGQRSLLKKIRIIGSDGNTELPGYTFDYQEGSHGSMTDGPLVESINLGHTNRIFADVDGDNRDDLVLVAESGQALRVYRSNGDGTFDNPVPTYLGDLGPITSQRNYFADLNGDARADFIQHNFYEIHGDEKTWVELNQIRIFLSDGTGNFIAADVIDLKTNPALPLSWCSVTGNLAFSDFNADGYNDIYSTAMYSIYFNDGQGNFSEPARANLPDAGLGNFADVNGDGLTDLITRVDFDYATHVTYRFKTYLSTSNGGFMFAGQQDFDDLFPDIWSDKGRINAVLFSDANNDNKSDLIILAAGDQGDFIQTYISSGNGHYLFFGERQITKYSHFADINADGILDHILIRYREDNLDNGQLIIIDNYIRSSLSQNTAPFDLLSQAVSPSGAKMNYTYRCSSEVQNHFLPFIVYPVASLSVDDGVPPEAVTSTFFHDLGYFDAAEREYRGFARTLQTHPDGSATRTYHFVGDANNPDAPEDNYYFKGRIRRQDKLDAPGGAQLTSTLYTWDKVEDAIHPWAFVKLTSKRTEYYDDQTVFSQKDFQYDDANGNLLKTTVSGTGADPIVTEYGYTNVSGNEWNPLWRQSLEKTYYRASPDNPDRHSRYEYDTAGNLEQKILVNAGAENSVWRYDYYANGNLHHEYDANGNPPTTYTYEVTGTFAETITNPAGHVIQKTWDHRNGLENSITDANNQVTTHQYDPVGRLLRTDFPDGGQTHLTYYDTCSDAACSNVTLPRTVRVQVKQTDTATGDTVFYFDGLARKIQTAKTGEGHNLIISKSHYDNMGRIEFESGPFFQQAESYLAWPAGEANYPISEYPYTATFFDKRGRPVQKLSRDGQNGPVSTTYRYNGFATTITDPDNCAKTEIRDHLERIIEVVEDPAGQAVHTTYQYNAASDLLQVRNHFWSASTPDENRTEIQYDTLGRKTAMHDPDMGQWFYQYDANGNLILQTDANGRQIRIGYDTLNRIESKHYPDSGDSITYTYDQAANGIGLPYRVANTDVTTVFAAYDPMGRKLQEQKTIAGTGTRTTLYSYDYAGHLKKLTYPHTDASSAFSIDYALHPGTSLVHSATGPDATIYAQFSGYQPSGKPGRIDFGNGAQTTYTYDGWSQHLTAINTTTNGANPQNRQYLYSPAGDITEIDDLSWIEHYYYTYDKLHRLTSETTSTGSAGVTPGVFTMHYDAPGHLHAVSSVTHNGIDHAYSYDANGNQQSGPDLTDPQHIVQRTIAFNADNMPTRVAHPSGGTIDLVYDAENTRSKKTGPNGTTYYFPKEFEIINNIETCYIFVGNLRVAMVKNSQPDSATYFHKDHLGSSTVLTRADGSVVETTRYMPYGGKRGEGSGITATSYKFTDQELDAESGLYNYDARLYDPIIGRFASVDSIIQSPFHSQSFDRYAYCFGNPIIYTDPSGYEAEQENENSNSDNNNSDNNNNVEAESKQNHENFTYGWTVIGKTKHGHAISQKGNVLGWTDEFGFTHLAEVSAPSTIESAGLNGGGHVGYSGPPDAPISEPLIGPVDFVLGGYGLAKAGIGIAGISLRGIRGLAAKRSAKSLADQAAELVSKNSGKSRVTLRSPSRKVEVDLIGKSHGGVPTPHTKVSPLNPRAPKQPAYNTKNSPVNEATQQDIRTVRRYLERKER